jgi:hypothetical protein
MAQFHLGTDDKTINAGNEMGVMLGAIKGLYQELQERDATIAALKQRLAAQDAMMAKEAATEARVLRLEAQMNRLSQPAGLREAELSR